MGKEPQARGGMPSPDGAESLILRRLRIIQSARNQEARNRSCSKAIRIVSIRNRLLSLRPVSIKKRTTNARQLSQRRRWSESLDMTGKPPSSPRHCQFHTAVKPTSPFPISSLNTRSTTSLATNHPILDHTVTTRYSGQHELICCPDAFD
eukprot:scaffold2578_cov230-Pinguiococcus_pyrenoidosus.AAC.2